ncbi:MAG TPA: precorrin-3B C(17)-methyltransferase [Acetobacteraceae bacterium]|nr:precorrin-3B C(17)-methyltransferase [Acetobacteraceae bacterium]
MSGRIVIVGLGPGGAETRTPQAEAALAAATDLIGYGPYIDRVPERPGQVRHASDNREEIDRARHALAIAEAGRVVAVVSSGDAGVFAMASAVFEAIEHGEPSWRGLDVSVVPGISAMFAAASRLGAPLGHDFCAISLSDNLKPWETVTRRLAAAASAGFVIALYNPASRARPWQLGAAFDLLRTILPGETPVAFATAVTTPAERITVTTLAAADPARADMRTLVMIGSPATRMIGRADGGAWLYTPRRADAPA